MTSPFGIETAVAEPQVQTLPDTFTVDVTDEDIQLGVPGADRCAIQRATVRELFLRYGVQPLVRVGFSHACIEGDDYDHDGHEFIAKFDSYIPVEPCRVTLTRR